jgi:hypothetical protein
MDALRAPSSKFTKSAYDHNMKDEQQQIDRRRKMEMEELLHKLEMDALRARSQSELKKSELLIIQEDQLERNKLVKLKKSREAK